MELNHIFLIILIFSGLEIFTNFFTKFILRIIRIFNKEYIMSEKLDTIIKLIFVAGFLASSIYFLFQGVIILANWLNIPLDKSILDFITE